MVQDPPDFGDPPQSEPPRDGEKLPFPHDSFFKEMLKTPELCREFFQAFLPEELLAAIDLESLGPADKHFISPNLRHYFADSLFTVKAKDSDAEFYLLVEHSAKPSKNTTVQVHRYEAEIWADVIKKKGAGKIPYIHTLIFYTGKAAYHPPTDIKALIEGPPQAVARLWNEPYQLIRVRDISVEEARQPPHLGVMLLTFKHFIEGGASPLKAIFNQLGKIEDGGLRLRLLRAVLSYIFEVKKVDSEALRKLVTREINEEAGKMVMTTAEILRKEGREVGREEGREVGREEGREVGRQEMKVEWVQKWAASGMTPSQIADLLGLPLPEVHELLQRD